MFGDYPVLAAVGVDAEGRKQVLACAAGSGRSDIDVRTDDLVHVGAEPRGLDARCVRDDRARDEPASGHRGHSAAGDCASSDVPWRARATRPAREGSTPASVCMFSLIVSQPDIKMVPRCVKLAQGPSMATGQADSRGAAEPARRARATTDRRRHRTRRHRHDDTVQACIAAGRARWPEARRSGADLLPAGPPGSDRQRRSGGSAKTQMTPPCGTTFSASKCVFTARCMPAASTPQPDCTATYCTPSIS